MSFVQKPVSPRTWIVGEGTPHHGRIPPHRHTSGRAVGETVHRVNTGFVSEIHRIPDNATFRLEMIENSRRRRSSKTQLKRPCALAILPDLKGKRVCIGTPDGIAGIVLTVYYPILNNTEIATFQAAQLLVKHVFRIAIGRLLLSTAVAEQEAKKKYAQ